MHSAAQCGAEDRELPVIPSSESVQNESRDKFHTGCGYLYQSKSDCDAQCGSCTDGPQWIPNTSTPSNTGGSNTSSTPESCRVKRLDKIYVGCGYGYETAAQRAAQCGAEDSELPVIPSSESVCKMNRADKFYTGCGYLYQSKSDCDAQCGSCTDGPLWIPPNRDCA